MKRIFLFPALALALILAACSNPSGGYPSPSPTPTPTPSSAKAITGFSFPDISGTVTVDIKAGTRTVSVTVPPLTALTGLAPVVTINGASVSPASGAAQDFFTTGGFLPVVYTVTGADGSKAVWTVTVKWAPLNPGDIAVYLGSSPPAGANGGVPGGPVILPVNADLSGGGWADLLTAINGGSASAVALDLSACPGAAVFDPQPGVGDAAKGKIVSLILPDTATSIKDGTYNDPTFKNFSALKSVTGGTVADVGDYAFTSCAALETVSFPAATNIGYTAFRDCDALETVSFPAATTIEGWAFDLCDALKTVDLPAAATIGSEAFRDCDALETISLPVVTSLDFGAFQNCTSLASISLPASLTTISGNPFHGCSGLTITVDADNLTYMADGGKLLTKDGKTLIGWPTASGSVDLSDIITVSLRAFMGCDALTSVTLLAATSIGSSAFTECHNLTSVTLPAATSIVGSTFQSCNALETVNLLAATSIGSSAFSGCAGLTSVSLPAATSIGAGAFYSTGTGPLTIILGPAVPMLGTNMFASVTGGPKLVTVTVPNGAGAWTGKTGTFTSAENTTGGPHWGEGFRGKGWTSGGAYDGGAVNEAITLTVQEETL